MHRGLLVAMLLLTLYVSGCVTQEGGKVTPTPVQAQTEKVLQVANQSPEVQLFVAENPGYEATVSALAPENTSSLAEKYPVLYGGLPNKTLYKVEYKKDAKGILVIVDVEDAKVLKYFQTTGVVLGG
jgi:hypothetical protein